MTLKDAYCATYRCPPTHFERQFLAHVIHRRARLLVALPFIRRLDFFGPDRELVHWLGAARDKLQIEEAVRDFRRDFRNSKRLRRVLKLRISTRRLRRVVNEVWPSAARGGDEIISRAARPGTQL